MKNAIFSAPARTDILFGIAVLVLRFLIYQVESGGIALSLFNFVLWLIAWAAIIIGMAKLGKREDWQNGLRERTRENGLLSAAVSASARIYIIAGIALQLLLILAVVLFAVLTPPRGQLRCRCFSVSDGACSLGGDSHRDRQDWQPERLVERPERAVRPGRFD